MKLTARQLRRIIRESLDKWSKFNNANQLITLLADSMDIEYQFEKRANGAIYTFPSYRDFDFILSGIKDHGVQAAPYAPSDLVNTPIDGGRTAYSELRSPGNYKIILYAEI